LKQTLHDTIKQWYHTHGRSHLPWRHTRDPYRIYLSEVMLQQTQVDTVLNRFYTPFLEKFPTLKALGDAPLDEVLKAWEGLGYYRRAKYLHTTAQSIEQLPSSIDELMKLSGIGKNTAHAIASFAFGQAVPIMEANIKRLLCRIHQLQEPKEKELWEMAWDLLDKEHPFDYNQAMMDIGALVCKIKKPLCEACPLTSICQGQKTPHLYPTKKRRTTPTRRQHILLYRYKTTLALYQRRKAFLHGLWGFPTCDRLPIDAKAIGEVTQSYSHFKLEATIYLLDESSPSQPHYFTPKAIQSLAISRVDEKILNLYLSS
jgi:A/G-specific adenine glycosylase